MEKFTLEADEGIVLRGQNVAYNAITPFVHEIVLTNKNLIVLVKGFFGGVKNVVYIPLNQVKVINGKPQAMLGKHKNGTTRVELYMTSGDIIHFSFNTLTRMEATKWVNTICKLLVDEEENGYNPADYAIPGVEAVAESIKGTVDTVRNIFNKKTTQEMNALRRGVFCQNCGANYEGISGRTGKCPYCGTVQNIN